jgi:hypothetical protein
LMLSQLTGLLAAAAVDGDLEKGSEIAQKASTYNWLTHREIEDADKARAGCSALGAGAGACEKKIIRDMEELDKSRNLGMFDLERSLQLSVLRDGITQGEYREALLDGFNGLDPRDLAFTGYEPANELGYRAEALGSHVVDLAADFPGRFKAGLEGLINNYDQIPAGIAQAARDGVDWWTGPIPEQAIARAEDKLVFSTPEQLGDRLFDMTLGTAAGAAGGLVGGKAIEWFAGRWATLVGAEGVGAKGTTTAGELAGAPPKNPLLDDSILRDGDRLVVNQGPVPTCGHNSCGMALDTLGKKVDIGSLIQRIAPSEGGIYARDVASLMTSEGVPASAFGSRNVADLARYTGDGTPVVVRIVDNTKGTDFSHFVVVDGVTTRNGISVVAIRDPHGAQYFSPVSTFQRNFSGEVVVPRSALK